MEYHGQRQRSLPIPILPVAVLGIGILMDKKETKKMVVKIKLSKKNVLVWGTYSHFSNNRGGWNKHGGGAKVAKSLNVEVGINMEGGIF